MTARNAAGPPMSHEAKAMGGASVSHVTKPVLTILIDTREQTPPPFPETMMLGKVETAIRCERATLDAADYTTDVCQGIAVIERKNPQDFLQSITHGRERFEDELRRLREYRWRLIVVEGDLTNMYRMSATHPHGILGSISSLTARHDCPVIFAGNASGAARLIVGCLYRWGTRIEAEKAGKEQ